ncbi:hypothetical protein BU26DRAFT_142581 [Trematosphaeria pertusa]|uniref:Uncharacterized protein n=1 Tax=Trematosphaeria pertusa TaxID=390896 RepID=A0A6A6IXH1_9PLEO|nr:uncharacterized protein BU26DRAFT_142581 [Trematosphaeria pertusa]KAF2254632.1 hypothetical protein BU26DRAFT_142581 [Trematosphaeria pertusa]
MSKTPVRIPKPSGSLLAAIPPPPCDLCGHKVKPDDAGLFPTRCNDCVELIKDWVTAPSWKYLVEMNREFVIGASSITPYSIYPIFNDVAMRPGILRLHDYGFIVTDAQPGYAKIGQDQGKWFEIKERAFMRCVLPTYHPWIQKGRVDLLLGVLGIQDDLELIVYAEYAEYEEGGNETDYRYARPKNEINLQTGSKLEFFYSSVGRKPNPGRTDFKYRMPTKNNRTLSKYRIADSEESLKWVLWKRCTGHPGLPVVTERDIPPRSTGRRAFGREFDVAVGLRPVIVTIVSRDWPPLGVDLPVVVEDCCRKAGLKPVFGTKTGDKTDEDPDLPALVQGLSLKGKEKVDDVKAGPSEEAPEDGGPS